MWRGLWLDLCVGCGSIGRGRHADDDDVDEYDHDAMPTTMTTMMAPTMKQARIIITTMMIKITIVTTMTMILVVLLIVMRG